MITPYHAKYYASKLTQISGENNVEKLSMSLMNSAVDINPHQIESALFALRSPLAKGVILADEVGLGKTIEAGLILCQYWAEMKRRLLVICPASLRKQWGMELMEKFNLPSIIIDSDAYQAEMEKGKTNPFEQDMIVIVSINFASSKSFTIEKLQWDLVVIDEAHKLRNVYKKDNKMANRIKDAIQERKKILLTATPLQNNVNEIYGLSTIIDETIFGSIDLFINLFGFMFVKGRVNELFEKFVTRTLRSQVSEYIQYTKRKAITINYEPSSNELSLYEAISRYLFNPDKHSRLNICIKELQVMADFFENKMNKSLDKLPEKRIIDSLIDSLKINPSKSKDFKFNAKVNEWLKGNAYYLNSYLLSHFALAKCYELLDGKQAWEREIRDCKNNYENYTNSFSKRLVFLLKENSISIKDSTNASKVLSKISEKAEYSLIKSELDNFKEIICRNSNMHLLKDANCIEILYTVDSQDLIGGTSND